MTEKEISKLKEIAQKSGLSQKSFDKFLEEVVADDFSYVDAELNLYILISNIKAIRARLDRSKREWQELEEKRPHIKAMKQTATPKTDNEAQPMPINELRAAAGMTQKQFAEYFGIPQRTIENWCGGQRKCPAYLLELMQYKLEKENLIK